MPKENALALSLCRTITGLGGLGLVAKNKTKKKTHQLPSFFCYGHKEWLYSVHMCTEAWSDFTYVYHIKYIQCIKHMPCSMVLSKWIWADYVNYVHQHCKHIVKIILKKG